MKKSILFLLLIFVSVLSYGQAKKPTIMIVPSDNFCISQGYFTTININGADQKIPDYKKAFQENSQIRMVITKMGSIMSDRGFPLKDLEQTLKSIETEGAELSMLSSKSSGAAVKETPIDVLKRTAKADIIMDLDYTIKRQGPNQIITFNLRGLDAYTNKQVAAAAGVGSPSSFATADLLLEEAVLSYMDGFNGQLQKHFDDMFKNGREVMVVVRVWGNSDVDLETEYTVDGEKESLSTHIENWMSKNTVSGRFSTVDATENVLKMDQVRIPMMYTNSSGREIAMDTRRFVTNLNKYLSSAPFNIETKIYQRGLGEAWLIIGEK
ncbi:MAG: DUF6175 family protein [Paludibacter sp.]|jgi:hypothetical protein|nr:DUF6175 family protein [Paludibacter sp.]